MADESIVFDRFELGLDLRKDKSTADSNRLRSLLNAYVTSGWTIRKRPGLRYVGTAPDLTAGLTPFSGALYCYSRNQTSSTPMSDGTILETIAVPNPDDGSLEVIKENAADVYNGFIFVSVMYDDGSTKMHFVDTDASPGGPWHITDANCPNSTAFVVLKSKVWAINQEDNIVNFCATDDPTDWTTASSAGDLPTGLQSPGDPEPQGLGEFNSQLCVFQRDSIQIWTVDPDPQLHQLDKTLRNVGSPFSRSISPVSNDLYFLSQFGFRSIGQQKFTEQYQDVDVGAAIDEVVIPHLEANPSADPLTVFFGRYGQYWCAIDNVVWVYTFSRTSKVSAWAKFELPFPVDAICNLQSKIYIRSGNDIYLADDSYYLDNGQMFTVDFLMAFQHFKASGFLKQITEMDVSFVGTADVSVRYLIDAGIPGAPPIEEETTPIEVTGDSRAGTKLPVEVVAEQIAAHVTHTADEEFELNMIQFGYNKLNMQ